MFFEELISAAKAFHRSHERSIDYNSPMIYKGGSAS